jgi:hypothetical protein
MSKYYVEEYLTELEKKRYKIIRFFHPNYVAKHGGPTSKPVTSKGGLTIKEAQRHCKDPNTRRDGEYFDGYTEE